MKIPSIFKTNSNSLPKWHSCNSPKTSSFRTTDVFKTVNSVFFEKSDSDTSETTTSSTGDPVEAVVRAARSERLIYEPGRTSSIIEAAKNPFRESDVIAMESEDPYVDFKRSIEEMVESRGISEWEDLEELMRWYLKVNGKSNHETIISAFVDVLIGIAESDSSSSTTSDDSNSTAYSSAVSSFSVLPS